MSKAYRQEDKKRRRQKRLAKREHFRQALDTVLDGLGEWGDVAAPGAYPGASDPSLERPDRVKFELAMFVERGPGRDHLRRFESHVKHGVFGSFPQIDHWCMEEFFWHGAPGSSWNPIDQFLASAGDRYPSAAQRQISLWKEARIGFYEIGDVADDLVAIRELDPRTLTPAARWTRAISLCIGGVAQFADQKGQINLGYAAPWAPEKNIQCMMGYGASIPRQTCLEWTPLVLGMQNVKAIAFPLPWKFGKVARQHFLEEWRRRDWYTWMKERVRCPFQAVLPIIEQGPQILTIDAMMTHSSEEARRMGIYFSALVSPKEAGLFGASGIMPLDFDSPTAMAFAEYRAYRDIVGPPPATRGM